MLLRLLVANELCTIRSLRSLWVSPGHTYFAGVAVFHYNQQNEQYYNNIDRYGVIWSKIKGIARQSRPLISAMERRQKYHVLWQQLRVGMRSPGTH